MHKRMLALLLISGTILTACGKEEPQNTEVQQSTEKLQSPIEELTTEADQEERDKEADTERTEETQEEAVGDAKDSQAQIQLIADCVDEWAATGDGGTNFYAITDLDGNGRLEIIAATCGGTGLYTYSSFYEVNETYDGIDACDYPAEEGESQPDIVMEQVNSYFDEDTGIRYFVFEDVLRNGAAEVYFSKQGLYLEHGVVASVPVASMSKVADENGELTVTAQDGMGIDITESEYDEIEDVFFGKLEKRDAFFQWMNLEQVTDMEKDELVEALQTSYNGFGFN
ncbi:MAG: hypothetical protein IJ567_11645 [Lachnospiraceae bacterium]|nr:hypothetical protein [Lachnospiraceae bacterium]